MTLKSINSHCKFDSFYNGKRLILLPKVRAPVLYVDHCTMITFTDSGHRDWLTYLLAVILDSGAQWHGFYAQVKAAQRNVTSIFATDPPEDYLV